MSVLTDVLDRLSGVAVVREKLSDTTTRVEKLGDWVLNHERRITTLEAGQGKAQKKLPSGGKKTK